MFGAVEFYKKAEKAGVKPIIGMEAYIVTKGSRHEKSSQPTETGGSARCTITLFCLQKMNKGTET